LGGKPEGKGLLGRPRKRWEDNIRMGLREIGWEVLDWIDLDVEHCNDPSGSIKGGEFLD
jgi:hypothetical protein